jgi:hypothetical protein
MHMQTYSNYVDMYCNIIKITYVQDYSNILKV